TPGYLLGCLRHRFAETQDSKTEDLGAEGWTALASLQDAILGLGQPGVFGRDTPSTPGYLLGCLRHQC
ncbi:MAG TPA: hypothetical protein VK956_19355, partial [Verrucomicrobium sp.]|nr:hypothetical protein [Verrucomicrobium sp.]